VSLKDELDGLRLDTVAFQVLSYITFRGGHLKPSQIADGTNMKPSTVRARLAEMKDKGLVKQIRLGGEPLRHPHETLQRYKEAIGCLTYVR
jgi:DNA-binding MarR family transcriptional regulator